MNYSLPRVMWIFCFIINLIVMSQGKEPSWGTLFCAIISNILTNIMLLINEIGEKE